MFESSRWRKTQHDAETAMQHAVQSLAQAGKAPIVIGSIAAMALLGMVTGIGLNHQRNGRSRGKVLAARVRKAAEDSKPASRNGRRGRKRKMKAAAN
jgi:hypothetical protein